MLTTSPPVFGKRNRPSVVIATAPGPSHASKPATSAAATDMPPDHAAFFAAVRSEAADQAENARLVVPWSFKAASLAGLAVGCALAGFNVTGETGTDRFNVAAGMFGVEVDTHSLLPAMIALGLFAGARVASATMLCVHAALSRIGWTSHLAYTCGGAIASVIFAALVLIVAGHPPDHGWFVELTAGCGGGLCYRAFAGARPADRKVKPAPRP